MAFIKITNTEGDTVRAVLSNTKNDYNIPVRITGKGLTHFKQDKDGQKTISINPVMVNVIKNSSLVYSMMDIRLTEMFGKTLMEGINTSDWHSPVVLELKEIKELWTDCVNSNGSVWNIEI